MVEVFKTNVSDRTQAMVLLHHIHKNNIHYKANFDLEDCDRILRVKSLQMGVDAHAIISLLNTFGFSAEVLDDEHPDVTNPLLIPIYTLREN